MLGIRTAGSPEPVADATGQGYTPLFDVLEERAAA